jgi:phosphate transport system protein
MRPVDFAMIDQQVAHLFAKVGEGIEAATHAFLQGDVDAARILVADDPSIDLMQSSTEALVEQEVAMSWPLDELEFRRLVSIIRIVPELERSADLVEHIALRASQGLAAMITPQARGLIRELGRIGAEMWRVAADAYFDHNPAVADVLRMRDNEIDDLHVRLSTELARAGSSNAVAIEMGLIGRFYERLGDHAVNVTRRVCEVTRPTDEDLAPV